MPKIDRRLNQLTFTACILGTCWLWMMAVHELGHVLGALCTGGTVQQVELSPLSISRTDVSPNPYPAVVVWMGPVIGCLLPGLLSICFRYSQSMLNSLARFFSGFCCVANGAYILFGSFDRIGDCGEMLRTGTHPATMYAFGSIAIVLGFVQWHRLGSLRQYLANSSNVGTKATIVLLVILLVTCAIMNGVSDWFAT